VATALNSSLESIHEVLSAKPSQFVILASGHGRSFEVNSSSRNWSDFKKKLEMFCEVKEEYEDCTEFRVNYQLFNNNSNSCLSDMKKLCDKLKIKLVESVGYINRYDDTLNLFQGLELSPEGRKEYEFLQWDLLKVMKYVSRDRLLSCLCQRIFPVVNYDKSVGFCHLYTEPLLHYNILHADYKSVMKERSNSDHCRKCQSFALRRLDVDVLRSRYGDSVDLQ
jgi:hypothetical protein